eukprot:746708-Ditylum_brightwellii.AAC.1
MESYFKTHQENFLSDGTPIMKASRSGPPLTVHQADTQHQVEIKYKSTYTPHKTLGYHKAPE